MMPEHRIDALRGSSCGDLGRAREDPPTNRPLGRAGKLNGKAGCDNACEFHPSLVDAEEPAILIIEPDDGVGVDIFCLVNEVAQNKLPPIVLERHAPFGMPGRGSLDLPDCIENTAAFDGTGGTDKHDSRLRG